jgi:hypothetical protein
VSARIDQDRFLITPTGMDRRSLEIEDIVLIEHGQRECGKVPSRSVRLHRIIYDRYPGIGCIITAQSPNVMAYAITDVPFDTRTIPEVISCAQHGHSYGAIMASRGSRRWYRARAVVLIRMTACDRGPRCAQAFDRLEVAETTARARWSDGARSGWCPSAHRTSANWKRTSVLKAARNKPKPNNISHQLQNPDTGIVRAIKHCLPFEVCLRKNDGYCSHKTTF